MVKITVEKLNPLTNKWEKAILDVDTSPAVYTNSKGEVKVRLPFVFPTPKQLVNLKGMRKRVKKANRKV